MTAHSFEARCWTWLRRLGWIGIAAGFIIPALGAALLPAWDWTTFDFVFAYVVLLTAGLLVECFAAVVRSPRLRIIFGLIIVFIFLAIWAWAVA